MGCRPSVMKRRTLFRILVVIAGLAFSIWLGAEKPEPRFIVRSSVELEGEKLSCALSELVMREGEPRTSLSWVQRFWSNCLGAEEYGSHSFALRDIPFVQKIWLRTILSGRGYTTPSLASDWKVQGDRLLHDSGELPTTGTYSLSGPEADYRPDPYLIELRKDCWVLPSFQGEILRASSHKAPATLQPEDFAPFMRMESRKAAIELPFGSYLLRNEFGEIRISVYPEGEEPGDKN